MVVRYLWSIMAVAGDARVRPGLRKQGNNNFGVDWRDQRGAMREGSYVRDGEEV
jgi:hypothetical protein